MEIGLRLLAAFALGWAVAWIYRHTRSQVVGSLQSQSLEATLVLLAILIAAVTQVIGDSVARAFSLVGALSIVRFRTVVRDTRDTAFVIFAVVVGMAAGARDFWLALLGLAVVGIAAYALSRKAQGEQHLAHFQLRVRCKPESDAEALLRPALEKFSADAHLMTISLLRSGEALEVIYEIRLLAADQAPAMLQCLRTSDAILDVRLVRHGFNEN